jgi:hypothetical protein
MGGIINVLDPGSRRNYHEMSMFKILAVFILLSAGAPRDPSESLQEARNLFLYQDCERAVPLLEALLYPQVRLIQPEQEQQAREYLGACRWWRQDLQGADAEFTALLLKKPAAALDPFYYPPEMVSHFGALRARLQAQGVLPGREPPPPQPTPPKPEVKVVEKVRVVRERPLYPVFLPFGVGQFANDQPVKGALFATGEVLALAANLTSYLVIESLRGPDGYFSPQRFQEARALRVVLYASAGTLGALYLGGVVDAWLNHRGDSVQEVAPAPAAPGPEARAAPRPRWTPVSLGLTPGGGPLFLTGFHF